MMLYSGIVLKYLREKEEKCRVIHAIKFHVSHNNLYEVALDDAFACMCSILNIPTAICYLLRVWEQLKHSLR